MSARTLGWYEDKVVWTLQGRYRNTSDEETSVDLTAVHPGDLRKLKCSKVQLVHNVAKRAMSAAQYRSIRNNARM